MKDFMNDREGNVTSRRLMRRWQGAQINEKKITSELASGFYIPVRKLYFRKSRKLVLFFVTAEIRGFIVTKKGKIDSKDKWWRWAHFQLFETQHEISIMIVFTSYFDQW